MTPPETADVVIVGAGPAGLAAAAALAAAGLDVHVLERERETGGIPRHCGHSLYGMREFRRVMGGAAYARALSDAAVAAGARLHPGVTVTALGPGGALETCGDAGRGAIRARAVLLALGARETPRSVRLIGGDRPGGVYNTGALQGLVYLRDARPFRRPVVLGTELVSFSALLTCRAAGARPVAMIEPGGAIAYRAVAGWLPRLLGVPLHLGTELIAIHGRSRVESVSLRRDGRAWDLACDGVVITGGFRPENALLRTSHIAVDPGTQGPAVDQFGRCSDPAYFAAGNLLRGVETAPWCWREGRRVAAAIRAGLAGALPDPVAAHPIRVDSDAVAWTVPQRLAPSALPAALPALQIGLSRPVSGVLRHDGTATRLRSRPGLRALAPMPSGPNPLRLDETP